MDSYTAITTRRSVRKYLKKKIHSDDLKIIVNSGIWAPSGLNNQPWKFQIINDKDKIKAISRFTQYQIIIENAQSLICVFLDKSQIYNREKDLMAIGACIQNMLLTAWQLGIGSCWLGEILNQKDKVCSCLSINNDLELMAVISLGYPKGADLKGKRKELSGFLLE